MTSWYDLDADDRADWVERAEDETGQSFYDLSADERASWVERAEEGADR